jgi:hypothetical protein
MNSPPIWYYQIKPAGSWILCTDLKSALSPIITPGVSVEALENQIRDKAG